MKKVYLACSLLVTLVMTQSGFAAVDASQDANNTQSYRGGSYNRDSHSGSDSDGSSNFGYAGGNACSSEGESYAGTSCEAECPPEHKCNEQYTLYCRYEPCYYNKTRCEYESYPCYKKCVRQVPKYYQKQCCRYVPQYYTQTCCKYVPETYTTCTTKYRPKYVSERCCKYVPKYYYKRECNPAAAATAPADSAGVTQ